MSPGPKNDFSHPQECWRAWLRNTEKGNKILKNSFVNLRYLRYKGNRSPTNHFG